MEVDSKHVETFPAKLAQKCRSIYEEAFGNNSISYSHHYFVLITPKPGIDGAEEEKTKIKITEVIKTERSILQLSNILVLVTTRVSYLSEIKRLMASLTCIACSVHMRSYYHRAYNMDTGGCSGQRSIARPLLSSM